MTGTAIHRKADELVRRHESRNPLTIARELGHCVTGAMYNMNCPIMPRQRYEKVADAYAIKKLVDEDELKRIIDEREGDISVWELSEWFDVTEEFMNKALRFYLGER